MSDLKDDKSTSALLDQKHSKAAVEEIAETKEPLDSINNNTKPIKEAVDPLELIDTTTSPRKNIIIDKKKAKNNKRVSSKRPKIEFEELVWDFGEITEGDIVEKKFKFTNTGNAPLEIKSTSATCGCTRPTFPFLEILPGQSNVIGVTYNSVGKEGPQNPEVTIESNTKLKITTLKLKGLVTPKQKADQIPVLVKDTSGVNH